MVYPLVSDARDGEVAAVDDPATSDISCGYATTIDLHVLTERLQRTQELCRLMKNR
jgi:hypothetical protein